MKDIWVDYIFFVLAVILFFVLAVICVVILSASIKILLLGSAIQVIDRIVPVCP